jgi:hypothetical protein
MPFKDTFVLSALTAAAFLHSQDPLLTSCRIRAKRPRALDEPFVKRDAKVELGGFPCKIDRRLSEFG